MLSEVQMCQMGDILSPSVNLLVNFEHFLLWIEPVMIKRVIFSALLKFTQILSTCLPKENPQFISSYLFLFTNCCHSNNFKILEPYTFLLHQRKFTGKVNPKDLWFLISLGSVAMVTVYFLEPWHNWSSDLGITSYLWNNKQ